MKGKSRLSRRDFVKSSVLGAASLAVATNRIYATGSGKIRIGLVGCGGRGTGAAAQALTTGEDVVLTAMGDVFENRLQSSLKNLMASEKFGQRVKVSQEECFVGLDAYQKVIDSGVDVVLLATPPGFRPQYLRAAVEAGKHVFCEKPPGRTIEDVHPLPDWHARWAAHGQPQSTNLPLLRRYPKSARLLPGRHSHSR